MNSKRKELNIGDEVWVMNDEAGRDGRTYKIVSFLENGYIKLDFRGDELIINAFASGVVKAVER